MHYVALYRDIPGVYIIDIIVMKKIVEVSKSAPAELKGRLTDGTALDFPNTYTVVLVYKFPL